MASHLHHERLDLEEQIFRMEKMIVEIQSTRQTIEFEPRKMFVQATLAAAALLGAGVAAGSAIASFLIPG